MRENDGNRESKAFRNAFIGQPKAPTDRELTVALGAGKVLWDELLAGLADEYKLTPEWNSYSKKAGWSLRLKQEKRNIVYLAPSRGRFMASLALGDKAIDAAYARRLPQRDLKLIAEAKKYAEGTAVRIMVTGRRDIAVVKRLARLKLEN